MGTVPFDQLGGTDDRVDERADLVDVDLDDVAWKERELVGWDEAGPCQEDASGWDGIVDQQPLDELRIRASHLSSRRLSHEELTPVLVGDPQMDAEWCVELLWHVDG